MRFGWQRTNVAQLQQYSQEGEKALAAGYYDETARAKEYAYASNQFNAVLRT